MLWLFLTCKYTKHKIVEFRNLTNSFAMFKLWRSVAFETETCKNGSVDFIIGSDIDVHCIYYKEYWIPHCILGSDGVSIWSCC